MNPKCIQAVQAAAGRVLRQSEIDRMDTMIRANARALARQDRQAWLAMSPDQRLIEAGHMAGRQLVAEGAKARQRVALTIQKAAERERFYATAAAQGFNRMDALERQLRAVADSKLSVQSLESRIDATKRLFLSQLYDVWNATDPRIFGLFEDKKGIDKLTREIFGESTGNATAAKAAKVWTDTMEAARQQFNALGGDVGRLDTWGLPQHHSLDRVFYADGSGRLFGQQRDPARARETWVRDTLPLVNREAYTREDGTLMDDGEVTAFLGHAYDTISTGGLNKLDPSMQVKTNAVGTATAARFSGLNPPPGSGSAANRGSASRQIHFKDAASYQAYQAKYGDRDLYSVLLGHVGSVSRDIALVQTFGPNASQAFRFDLATATKAMADKGEHAGAIAKRQATMTNLYDFMSGNTQPPASMWVARFFDSARNVMSWRLGSAVISSFSDEATMKLTASVNNISYMQTLRNELALLNPLNAADRERAQRAGLGMESLIGSLNRFGQDGMGASWTNKVATGIIRASLLNALTDARKAAWGTTWYSATGKLVRDNATLAGLDAADNRVLLSKGITERDWSIWRAADQEDWGGGNPTVLTPEAVMRTPDSAIDALLPANLRGDATARQSARFEAAQKLMGAVLEEVDTAVQTPRQSERARMLGVVGSPQRGTIGGELWRSALLFKSFPISLMMRQIERLRGQPGGMARVKYAATLIGLTTLAGMAALQTKELIAGRNPKNMNPFEGKAGKRNWVAAMVQGGSLGLYGDFLFSDTTRYGQTPFGALAGPLIGTLEEFVGLTQGNLVKAALGKETHAGADAIKILRGLLPGTSLWYTKAVLDHLIFQQLQEMVSPGYNRRVRQRAQREFGQSYYWPPGTGLEGAQVPDPSQAWQTQ